MGEEPFHLRRALDIELVGIELEALGIVDGVRGLHAQQHLMRVMIVFAEIVAVVGGDQRNIQFFFQAEQVGMDLLFQFQSLVLDLQEEIAAAENVLVLSRGGFGLLVLSRHQIAAQLTGQAAGESDQALGMLGQISSC